MRRLARGLTFTPDGQTLAILEAEAVTLHCPSRGRFAGELPLCRRPATTTGSPSRRTDEPAAAGGTGGRRVIWDLQSRQLSHAGFGGPACRGLGFFPYGERLLWLDVAQITLWHGRGDGPPAPDFASAWVPGANALALARRADVRRRTRQRGGIVGRARPTTDAATAATSAVRAVAFSPDGRTLVSGSDDGTAIVWNATGLAGVSAGPLPAWEDLADADPLIARRAVWQLAASARSFIGRDRERVGAVEVEVAGIGQARQRRVDLRCRAGDGYAGAAVAADAGAGGHIEDAVSDPTAWW